MPNVAIIGSEKSGRTSLARSLGKKGTESDITLYNFVKGEAIYAFIDANGYPESLKSLVQSLSLSDISLVCVPASGLNAQVGECILALDLLAHTRGLFVITMIDQSNPVAVSLLSQKVKAITRGTSAEKWESIAVSTTTFEGMEVLKERLFTLGEEVAAANAARNDLPPRVLVDHFFNVTGMGCVVLGMVSRGTIRVRDALSVFPTRRPVEIRSIQSNDRDLKIAPAGTRVGIALKGVQAKEFDRGYMISEKEELASTFDLTCRLTKFTQPLGVGDVVHLFAGLQSVPARIESIAMNGGTVPQAPPGSDCRIALSAQKEIAYDHDDRFLIANLNAKQRCVAGCGVG